MNRIAIYGFGRLGRSTLKAALRHRLFTPVIISDTRDLATLAALFAYDSIYGAWGEPVKAQKHELVIGERSIGYADATPNLPDWKALGVEIVIDCSECNSGRVVAKKHLAQGAKRVLLSSAGKSLQDCDTVLLPGVNMDTYQPEQHRIISLGGSTTNALAPVIAVLKENFGVKSGFFTTILPSTNTQSLIDQPMKDRRSSWSATENIIPAFSEATRTLKFIWSNLPVSGKIYRVPVRTGSLVELDVWLEQPTNTTEVRNVFRAAALKLPLKGVLGVLEEEYASSRIMGESLSAMIDLPLLQVENRNFLSLSAWYDHEMSYATRLAETALFLAINQEKQ